MPEKRDPVERPKIKTLKDAEFWIGVHHQWGCDDSAHYVDVLDRLARLERPWWKRIFHG